MGDTLLRTVVSEDFKAQATIQPPSPLSQQNFKQFVRLETTIFERIFDIISKKVDRDNGFATLRSEAFWRSQISDIGFDALKREYGDPPLSCSTWNYFVWKIISYLLSIGAGVEIFEKSTWQEKLIKEPRNIIENQGLVDSNIIFTNSPQNVISTEPTDRNHPHTVPRNNCLHSTNNKDTDYFPIKGKKYFVLMRAKLVERSFLGLRIRLSRVRISSAANYFQIV